MYEVLLIDCRQDIVFCYDGDTDSLDVYFTQVMPGLVSTSDGPLDHVEEDII